MDISKQISSQFKIQKRGESVVSAFFYTNTVECYFSERAKTSRLYK